MTRQGSLRLCSESWTHMAPPQFHACHLPNSCIVDIVLRNSSSIPGILVLGRGLFPQRIKAWVPP